jgi:plasmid stabilization system protein ParE
MKVRFSRLALAELDAILTYVAEANPTAASQVEARVRRVVDRIAQFPEGAPEIPKRPGIRSVPLIRYPYVIHYAVNREEVVVLRILHGARRSPWERP